MNKNDKPAKAEILARLAEIESWSDKEQRYKDKTGNSMATFCKTHDINEVSYCRNRNLKNIPRKSFVKKVNKAFAAEGIE